jgi:hypothetical protein
MGLWSPSLFEPALRSPSILSSLSLGKCHFGMKGKIAEGRRGVNAFSSLYHPCHSTIEIGKAKKIASRMLLPHHAGPLP